MQELRPIQLGILVNKTNASEQNQSFAQPYSKDSYVYKSNLNSGYENINPFQNDLKQIESHANLNQGFIPKLKIFNW